MPNPHRLGMDSAVASSTGPWTIANRVEPVCERPPSCTRQRAASQSSERHGSPSSEDRCRFLRPSNSPTRRPVKTATKTIVRVDSFRMRGCFLTVGRDYACLMDVDFARLLFRICSVVNPPPQTLQRQLGGAACAITGAGCRSECLALTSSLPQCGQSRRIIRSADETSLAAR